MSEYQVVFRGRVFHTGGFGTACREYIYSLDKLGVDVKIGTSAAYLPEIDSEIRNLSHLIKKPMSKTKPKVLVYHNHPYNIDLKKARKDYKHIILNTVWETTKIPKDWFPTINEFDAVCVPSKQNMEALKFSGVKVPIFHVPHGADTAFFNPAIKKLQVDGAQGKFIFFSVFDFQHRKNPEGLFKAYWEEFKPDENVLLIVKTHWSGNEKMGNSIPQIINNYKKRLGFSDINTAPLKLITKILEKKELPGLYTLGNAFVLPTRGEGVGLPFIEALSSGLPVIATGWGGHMDFLHKDNAILVDYNLVNPSKSMNTAISRKFAHLFDDKEQLWAEPSIPDLRRKMRLAFENPAICKQKGSQGRDDMIKMSWDAAGIALKEAIENTIKRSII